MRKLLITTIGLLLSGCTQSVVLEPAEDANHPGCAEVMVRLPSEIGDLTQRYTTAQATSAWGEPAAIILRCGIAPVMVSELPCVTAGEVDWLVDDSAAPNFRFISFGRDPAIEVIVDSESASGISALEAVGLAVATNPAEKRCSTIEG